jgi:serine/threonine protein kinase
VSPTPPPDWSTRQLDRVVDEFESALVTWVKGAGPRPRLDDYLRDEDTRAAYLAALAPYDLEYRRKADEDARLEDYLNRYPEFRSTLFVFSGKEDPAPGHRVGNFRLVEELGRGGMGVVFRATDEELNQPRAVKIVHRELARRPQPRERFLREAQALARIDHARVVRVLHVGEAGARGHEVPYLVMPLLEGEPLDCRLERSGALAPAEVVRIGRGIAEGLKVVHEAGLIHRDVGPRNVWLRAGDDEVVLLDFGLARSDDAAVRLTATGELMGTPAYMAPEQAAGTDVDHRADLFALGGVLYQATTGRRPFPGQTIVEVLNAIANMRPDPPQAVNPAVPPALSALVMRLLEQDRERRPATAAEVVAELNTIAKGLRADSTAETVDHVPERPPTPTRRRRPRALWVVGVLVIGVVVWLVFGGLGTGSGGPSGGPTDAKEIPAVNPIPIRYHGRIDVQVFRDVDGQKAPLRVSNRTALPLRLGDEFRIEATVDPPAFLYVVWVDPGHDITPVYPWDPEKGWGTRPPTEEQTGRLSLPSRARDRWRAPTAKPGVTTMVLLARPTPLDVPDDAVRAWFEQLPELPLPSGGEHAAVWYDDYTEVTDPDRPRTFERVTRDDPFADWQQRLKAAVGGRAAFQTSVSFARTGSDTKE